VDWERWKLGAYLEESGVCCEGLGNITLGLLTSSTGSTPVHGVTTAKIYYIHILDVIVAHRDSAEYKECIQYFYFD
jgi:hypothetical protein